MKNQQRVLVGLKAFGYANLLFLVYALFSLKAFEGSLFLLIAPPVIALAGTVIYYWFWGRAFPGVEKKIGRAIMRPYILGAAITALSVALVCALGLYGSHHQSNIDPSMPTYPASSTSLTVSSSGTAMLRITAPQLWR